MIINSLLPPTSFQSVISGQWYIVTTDPKLGWVEVDRKYSWEELEYFTKGDPIYPDDNAKVDRLRKEKEDYLRSLGATDEQIEDLLLYLSVRDKQQACWLALAVSSGARFSELLKFETIHIDENF